jgi:hypothetical protein
MRTYSVEPLAPAHLLRCDRCGRPVGAVPDPHAPGGGRLTAQQAARQFPELVNDVTLHELVCGQSERGEPVPCLTCGRRGGRFRGCCRSCYNGHLLAVARGEATWQALAREGRAALLRTPKRVKS